MDELGLVILDQLRRARWPEGVRCPRCGHERCHAHAKGGRGGRRKWRCAGCGRTFTDLTGTPLARSHLSLTLWVRAARFLEGRERSCGELARYLGLRLATAWRLRGLLMRLLREPVYRRVFLEENR